MGVGRPNSRFYLCVLHLSAPFRTPPFVGEGCPKNESKLNQVFVNRRFVALNIEFLNKAKKLILRLIKLPIVHLTYIKDNFKRFIINNVCG